jgi:hypothetical protein
MVLYRQKTYFTAICTLLKIRAIFVQNSLCFAELLRKFLPVQIRAETRYHIFAFLIHGRLILLTQDTSAEHLKIENCTLIRLYFLKCINQKRCRIFLAFQRYQ